MKYATISVLFKHTPPYFIGSQIRGAFGHALKKTTCINPSYACEGCFATRNCLYFDFFEAKNVTHKYRLDFELDKHYYDFSLILFDSAVEKLPYIVSALHTMLTRVGLGKDNIIVKEFEMYVNDKSIIDNHAITLPKEYAHVTHIDEVYTDVTLKFVTPLRIKKNNQFVRDDSIELPDIINSIYQRQMQLLDKGFRKFDYEIQGTITSKDIYYKELTRKSNRQKTTMKLGGIMGTMTLTNLNKPTYEVLKIGTLIGAGKSTVFGLGNIGILTKEDSGE